MAFVKDGGAIGKVRPFDYTGLEDPQPPRSHTLVKVPLTPMLLMLIRDSRLLAVKILYSDRISQKLSEFVNDFYWPIV
jgi:hypothetical protein